MAGYCPDLTESQTPSQEILDTAPLRWLLLLGVVCSVYCYRPPLSGGGYSIPQIGSYPAPTPWNPGRHQGLPPAYHGKFKRSALEDAQFLDDETHKTQEISRAKRQIIYPTYRPPPTAPSRPILV